MCKLKYQCQCKTLAVQITTGANIDQLTIDADNANILAVQIVIDVDKDHITIESEVDQITIGANTDKILAIQITTDADIHVDQLTVDADNDKILVE